MVNLGEKSEGCQKITPKNKKKTYPSKELQHQKERKNPKIAFIYLIYLFF